MGLEQYLITHDAMRKSVLRSFFSAIGLTTPNVTQQERLLALAPSAELQEPVLATVARGLVMADGSLVPADKLLQALGITDIYNNFYISNTVRITNNNPTTIEVFCSGNWVTVQTFACPTVWKIQIDKAYWDGLGLTVFYNGGTMGNFSNTDPTGAYSDINVTTSGDFWNNYTGIVVSGTIGNYSVIFTDLNGLGLTTEALVGSGGHYHSADNRVQIDLQ
jgi:hypothetical protein